MEPPGASAKARRAPRLLWLALLLAAHPGVQAEIHVSVPPLVEVMRGERVTLNCTPSKKPDHFMLEWFLIERSGARRRLASAEQQGSELQLTVHDIRGRSPPYQLDPQGSLVLADAHVGDERDYMCVVTAGAAGTAEATSRLRVFAQPEATEVLPNKGTLSVMDNAPQIATCYSRNGNPAPQITWYRNGRLLEVPMEMNEEGYVILRTIREASGLLSLSSTLYLRVHKADRNATFHCVAQYSLPGDRHGRLDSPTFNLTLHYPTEHVRLWLGSPSTTEGWVREGDSVQLLCEGDGSPNPEYTFFRLQNKQEEVLSTNLEGKLTLEGVNRSQSGTYGCRVEDFDAAEDVLLSQTLGLRVACECPGRGENTPNLRTPRTPSIPSPAVPGTLDILPSACSAFLRVCPLPSPLVPAPPPPPMPARPAESFPSLEPATAPQCPREKARFCLHSPQGPPSQHHHRRPPFLPPLPGPPFRHPSTSLLASVHL